VVGQRHDRGGTGAHGTRIPTQELARRHGTVRRAALLLVQIRLSFVPGSEMQDRWSAIPAGLAAVAWLPMLSAVTPTG
jgi:hypothetical protein